MKIYKYRDLELADSQTLKRVERIIRHGLIWCARPDTLNDPDEFTWTCDFSESPRTISLVAQLLEEEKGRPYGVALQTAIAVIGHGRLGDLGQTVIDETIRRSRDEIGIACFGSTPDNPTLWARYGGKGLGVCIEVTAPDTLLGDQLHNVVYRDHRRLHIDDFIRARKSSASARLFHAILLTKSKRWESEGEVRFISKRQKVEVVIEGSAVTAVTLGPLVPNRIAAMIQGFAGNLMVRQTDPLGPTDLKG